MYQWVKWEAERSIHSIYGKCYAFFCWDIKRVVYHELQKQNKILIGKFLHQYRIRRNYLQLVYCYQCMLFVNDNALRHCLMYTRKVCHWVGRFYSCSLFFIASFLWLSDFRSLQCVFRERQVLYIMGLLKLISSVFFIQNPNNFTPKFTAIW